MTYKLSSLESGMGLCLHVWAVMSLQLSYSSLFVCPPAPQCNFSENKVAKNLHLLFQLLFIWGGENIGRDDMTKET